MFNVFISLLWFLCIYINFYKPCSISILDMYVWQMHFEHSLWQRSFMYDEIFVSLLLSILSLIRISLELCYFLSLDNGLLSSDPLFFLHILPTIRLQFIPPTTLYPKYPICARVFYLFWLSLSVLDILPPTNFKT